MALGASAAVSQSAAPQAEMQLWRLDCGDFVMKRFGAWFSDTFEYPAGARPLVGSCYLIRHGDEYMLWDTGMSDELIAKPFDDAQQSMSLKRSLRDQLAQIGVRPEQVSVIGISHYHDDHTGQAAHFPKAKLLIGKADWDALKASSPQWLKDARDDLAGGLFFLDLLGEKPLELGHRGKDLFLERQFVERVDLRADGLLLRERLLEDVGQRLELRLRNVDRLELDLASAREHEVEQLHRVAVLLLALQAKPVRRAGEVLFLAPRRHRQIRERGAELGTDLAVDGIEDDTGHRPILYGHAR